MEWRGAESAEEASERLVEEASLILDINASRASLSEGVAAQLRVRAGQRSLQSEAFGELRTLPGSERSVSPMMKSEAPVTSLFHGVSRTSIERNELPTFVLNLASSFGRRQHVRAQLQRASLLDQAQVDLWCRRVLVIPAGHASNPQRRFCPVPRRGGHLALAFDGVARHCRSGAAFCSRARRRRRAICGYQGCFEKCADRSGRGGLGLGSAGCWYRGPHSCRRRDHATVYLRKMC